MKNTKELLEAALIRAIKTMAQTALGMISVGAAISDINWLNVLSVALVAGVYSVLTSLATGLPEAQNDGTLNIDTTNPNKDIWRLDLGDNLTKVSSQKKIVLKVNPNAVLSSEHTSEVNK